MSNYKTFAEIYDEVEKLIVDDTSEMETIIKFLINHVYRIVWNDRDWKWLRKYTQFSITTGKNAYTVGELEIAQGGDYDIGLGSGNSLGRALFINPDITTSGIITLIDEVEVEKNAGRLWKSGSQGSPEKFRQETSFVADGTRTDKLWIYPYPSQTKTARLWWIKGFVELQNGIDVPLLPGEFHSALIYGAAFQSAMFDIETKAGPWATMYEATMEQMRQFNDKTNLPNSGNVLPWGL